MTRVNGGADGQACAMGGDTLGFAGTATATSTTSLTMSGATWTSSSYIGHVVTTGVVYGVVTANTGTVLTVDRWYAPATPGGTAGTTPGNVAFAILPGQAPYWYMALDTGVHTPGVGDTALNTEITTSGGGLIRKIATYAHTTSATSYSLAATFTANGSDSLGSPVTITNIGVFNTLTGSTGRMQFYTALSPTATISASGDSLTVTDTISM